MSKKILIISPTYFSEKSITGGGERYVDELSKSLAKKVDVTFLSFAKEEENYVKNNIKYIIKSPLNSLVNPIYFPFKEIWKADIVHIHQAYYLICEISFLIARLFFKKVFITDHGGGSYNLLSRLSYFNHATKMLGVSEFSANKFKNSSPVFGGVDCNKFKRENYESYTKNLITVLGRILPHKGFHNVIEQLKDEETLNIIGRVSDQKYYEHLNELSKSKNVNFFHDLDDNQLIEKLKETHVAIFPSTNIDHLGNLHPGSPELLGLAPLECLSLGIPTLVSNITAFVEIDFLNLGFKHDNQTSLRDSLDQALKLKPDSKYREFVTNKYTWDLTAKRCIDHYEQD